MIIDMDHAIFYMGDYADDIHRIVLNLKKWKKLSIEDRNKYIDDLVSYYEFDSADMIVGDIMLDRNQIIFDANINRDSLISLAKSGIMVIQKNTKRKGREI